MFFDVFESLCKKRDISVYKACIEIGLNRSVVAKWKGGAIPNGATLSRIADYFGVSVGYLLGQNEKKPSAEAEGNNSFLFALSGKTKGFTKEQQKDILDYAEYLKHKYKKD